MKMWLVVIVVSFLGGMCGQALFNAPTGAEPTLKTVPWAAQDATPTPEGVLTAKALLVTADDGSFAYLGPLPNIPGISLSLRAADGHLMELLVGGQVGSAAAFSDVYGNFRLMVGNMPDYGGVVLRADAVGNAEKTWP